MTECAKGWFGGYCHQRCHCQDIEESCDNVTGSCTSGCAAGWTGHGCQTGIIIVLIIVTLTELQMLYNPAFFCFVVMLIIMAKSVQCICSTNHRLCVCQDSTVAFQQIMTMTICGLVPESNQLELCIYLARNALILTFGYDNKRTLQPVMAPPIDT